MAHLTASWQLASNKVVRTFRRPRSQRPDANSSASPGDLHLALLRLWASLWANVEDEIARARGQGPTGAFLGLPQIAVEDLTRRQSG